MSIPRRLIAVLAVLILALSATGIVFAQSDGPDPDSPIKLETPSAEEEPADDESEDDSDTSLEADDGASPEAEASPIAAGDVSLAAMTLDSDSLPEGWFLIQESYTSAATLADSLAGQIDPDALLATGLENYYDSYYINAEGNTIRTYIISFTTTEGAADGFALLEDEETLVPNGSLTDSPGLAGVGSEPSEVTTGSIENGDGTQTRSHDISFTIGRYEVGAAMETYDGSDPDADLVEQMAFDLEARVESVLAGDPVDGIITSLPEQLIELDAGVAFEGFQTAAESFLINDPELLPEGFLSGYNRSASYSDSVTSILPYITVGISSFQSAGDVESALDSSDSIMPLYDELDEVDGFELDGADRVLVFTFASPEGEGEADSARIFVQIDDQLISIDVQGADDANEALTIGTELAELEINCAVDSDCVPANISDDQTI